MKFPSVRYSARKPRLAMMAMGVLGGGLSAKGVPVIVELVESLARKYEIVYYSFVRINESNVQPGIKVRQIFSGNIPGRVKYWMITARMIIDHLWKGYDLIYAISAFPTGQKAVAAGKFLKRPVVVSLISMEAAAIRDIGCGDLLNPSLLNVTRQVCQSADVLIMLSEFQKRMAINELALNREIKVLPMGASVARFPYHFHILSFPIHFIHVAYYHPIKDQDTLFKAFARISESIECHLTVVGEGFDNSDVEERLSRLNIRDKITFAGLIPNEFLPDYYRRAHIMLHTSRFESECTVVQEAMSSGVVVCGTHVGVLEGLGNTCAVTVVPGDWNELASRTLALIQDPNAYQRLQQNAREWITLHNLQTSAKMYASVFDELVTVKKSYRKSEKE